MREMFDIKDKESDLTSIQTRLMSDQRSKSNKYLNDYLDTFKWNITNYQTRLLWQLKNANMNNIENLFYDKILFDAKIDNMIWNLWKYVKYNEVSSNRIQESLQTKMTLQQIAKFVSKSTTNIINRDSKKIKLNFLKLSTNSLNSFATS